MMITIVRCVVRPVALLMLPLVFSLMVDAEAFARPDEKTLPPVRNVRVTPEKESIVVLYDLEDEENQGWEITLVITRVSNPTFRYVPKNVKGDIGPVHGSRTDLRIVWEYMTEMPSPAGDDYRAEISFQRLGGGFPWLWVGGGALAVGGLVAALVFSKGKITPPPPSSNLPDPPAR
jgi:hypothetical protein